MHFKPTILLLQVTIIISFRINLFWIRSTYYYYYHHHPYDHDYLPTSLTTTQNTNRLYQTSRHQSSHHRLQLLHHSELTYSEFIIIALPLLRLLWLWSFFMTMSTIIHNTNRLNQHTSLQHHQLSRQQSCPNSLQILSTPNYLQLFLLLLWLFWLWSLLLPWIPRTQISPTRSISHHWQGQFHTSSKLHYIVQQETTHARQHTQKMTSAVRQWTTVNKNNSIRWRFSSVCLQQEIYRKLFVCYSSIDTM